ncbi:TPA: hypothetical protein SL230_003579 [Pseudomonas aeruginosa]|nr:hypothetical protein [Pseudomonas aeruginosa]HEJ2792485.1 hypothetical protein [Pseudomonas aeruginosa]
MTASKIQMDQIRSTSATVTGENIRAGSQKKSSLSPAEGLQGASPDATCTCPSGGGSLRHPCPAHPAVEQAGGDERDFQAEGAQEVPSPVSQEYDRHLISLLRKGEALPGHQEEAADEIERLRDWNDHLNNTVLPNILNPNFLMLMKGGERLLDLCTKDGKFIGVSLNDMKDVFDWMVTHARIAPDHAALAQPSPPPHPASELDFSRPLETENGDPVKWICADVIEYKSARVCVAKDTGLVYSSPYIGLKIRNVMPEQAEAERPEVAEVAFVLRNIGAMDAEDIDGDNVDLRFEDAEGRDTGCDVSIVEYAEKAADLFEQHDRIVGALRAKIAQLRQHKNDYMDAGQETYRALQNEIREREAEIARLDGLVSGRTAERDAALARVAELERELRDEENAHITTIEQRDNAEHWADQLAKAIAERFGVDIGEHSNLNCPWNEALVWMQQPPTQAQHSVPEEFIGRLSEFLAQRGATGKALLRELRDMLAAAPGKEGV